GAREEEPVQSRGEGRGARGEENQDSLASRDCRRPAVMRPISSVIVNDLASCSCGRKPTRCAIISSVSNSAKEPRAMLRWFKNSLVWNRLCPSAILDGTDTPARRI